MPSGDTGVKSFERLAICCQTSQSRHCIDSPSWRNLFPGHQETTRIAWKRCKTQVIGIRQAPELRRSILCPCARSSSFSTQHTGDMKVSPPSSPTSTIFILKLQADFACGAVNRESVTRCVTVHTILRQKYQFAGKVSQGAAEVTTEISSPPCIILASSTPRRGARLKAKRIADLQLERALVRLQRTNTRTSDRLNMPRARGQRASRPLEKPRPLQSGRYGWLGILARSVFTWEALLQVLEY